ncbi:unnamed protein product [Phytomonas sp. Hart1]|nr:unnamed protein product [Phytomonas sp. Hart1]|eukprot:CCW71524.1 unnamed protein product [Phytomonas sp. isolate Hart1]
MISEVNLLYGGPGGYPTTGGGSSFQDDSCMLIWEATQMIQKSLRGQSMDVSRLLELTNSLGHILERTRQLYNNTIKECDATYHRVQGVDERLLQVENLVRRYADTRDPVVASDGYTYERESLDRYFKECSGSNSKAYSMQTKEELTDVVMPNMSLIRLVTHLKSVRLADIPQLVRRTPIKYFANSQPRSGWAEEENTLLRSVDPSGGSTTAGQQRVDPNPAHVPVAAAATAGSQHLTTGHRFDHDTNKANRGGSKQQLHPCLRVYGFCNFMSDCTFANYPYDACLNHIKGKCRFSQNCKELHVDPRNPHFQNPRSFVAHHGHGNSSSLTNANVNNNNATSTAGDVGIFSEILGERMVSSNGSKSTSNSIVQCSPGCLSQGSHQYNKSANEGKKNGSVPRMDVGRITEVSDVTAGDDSTVLGNDETLREGGNFVPKT